MKFKCGCEFETLDMDNINLDCPKTWQLIGAGLTKGIFQVEGSLGMRFCKKIEPRNIGELADVISLIRPGCLEAEFRENPKDGKMISITESYVKIKRGDIEPEYISPVLEPILKDTYSVPVYQEQLMKICTDFAGFTLKDSDTARKCLHGDTLFWTLDGFKKIKELEQRSSVLTFRNYENKINRTCRVTRGKSKPCVKVTFDCGKEIICTPDHRFLTNYGWVDAIDLTTKHYCIHELEEKFGNSDIDSDSIYMIIALITEGYLPDKDGRYSVPCGKTNSCTFVNKDVREINRFLECVKNKFGLELKTYTSSNGVMAVSVPQNIATKLGISRGLSGVKKLPNVFYNLPKEKLMLTLAKLIDFDGWVGNNGVFYTTKSKELAVQVMNLFECLGGVRAYIYTKTVDNYGVFYEVAVTDSRCLEKISTLRKYSSKITSFSVHDKNNFSKLSIPHNIWFSIVKNLIENSGYTEDGLIRDTISGPYYNTNINMTIDRLSDILSIYRRSKLLEFFIRKNAYWNQVLSVEDCGIHEVYDFEMASDRTPQAYANGILVHNSIGKKDAKLMATVEKDFIDGAIKMGNDESLARTIFGWIDKFSGYGFNRCLVGNTLLNRGVANQHSNGLYTVEYLFKIKNNYSYAKSIGKISLYKKLKKHGYGNCMAVCADGQVRPMLIKDIYFNGKKKVVKVTDNGGACISCTLNHKFMCPDGKMMEIGKIGIGGQILRYIDCCDAERNYCYNIHDKGHKVGVATIVSIEELFEEFDTYDVEMDTLEHNWIANGFVVSNSHAICYALVGYRDAYLKVHFPIEFFRNKLEFSDSGPDQLEEIKELVYEAKLFDIKVVPPDIRTPVKNFAFTNNNELMFGISHIKGVGAKSFSSIEQIGEITGAKHLFHKILHNNKHCTLFNDCCINSKINKGVMEALIKSGAFDNCISDNRIDLLVMYRFFQLLTDREINYLFQNEIYGSPAEMLTALFDSNTCRGEDRKLRIISAFELILKELGGNKKRMCLAYEKYYLGMPLSGNETELYNNTRVNTSCRDFLSLPTNSMVSIGVVIESIREIVDKNNRRMCFMSVSDSTYLLNGIVVFSSVFLKCGWIIEEGKPVLIRGKKQDTSLLVSDIEHL